MQADKKTFTKAEVEVIRFENSDIITTSGPSGTTETVVDLGDSDE